MALGWLEKMLWFTPTHNITVASFGHDLGGSTYCGAYYLPTQVRPRRGEIGFGLLCSVFATQVCVRKSVLDRDFLCTVVLNKHGQLISCTG